MEASDPGRLAEELRWRLRDPRAATLAGFVRETHPADLAAALRELELADQLIVLRQLPREQAGAVLYEMDEAGRPCWRRWIRARSPASSTRCLAMITNMLVAP